TVYERADRIGGLCMYGIPNMKLDKGTVERRVDQLRAEGVTFVTGVHVGAEEAFEPGHMTGIMRERSVPLKFVDPRQLVDEFDAVLLATGATKPFDPTANAPGRSLDGIHFAMDFLTRNTKSLLDSNLGDKAYLSAEGLDVVVIGGGDTGADCIGTSLRHGARSVVNLEVVPQPPDERGDGNPWPQWPQVYRVDYSHAEMIARTGDDPRRYQTLTKEYVGRDGKLTGVQTVTIDWSKPVAGGAPFSEVEGSEKVWPADLVLLSTGFVGPELSLVDMIGLETQAPRGNWKTIRAEHGKFATSVDGVFAAGDCRRGQSLVVWAINEGRGAARAIDQYLMGF
ncbi:MAG: glutamate synthase subunit beta, partial [Planctomycetota bacterium]